MPKLSINEYTRVDYAFNPCLFLSNIKEHVKSAAMSYIVLARQYRPKNFAEMVGQDHVVQALVNALKSQRLHHAYLFTGTRGVGKTTISRILAKSLNCVGKDGQGGITDEPCGVCSACQDIDAGRFVDYIELDAASNRGVDEISQLLEQAVYKPVVGRFKVFMIDEVHMLSNTAFNAMLKTLEEPPEYLKFVLATTDPQKVPVTVLSRCLQFNLRPMAPDTISEHLASVLGKENVAFDAASLRLIARAARGSMRDALSLVDQAIAFGSGAIEEAGVRQMLGAVDQAHVYRLIHALAIGDGKQVVELVDMMRTEGISATAALDEMTSALQRIAILKTAPELAQHAEYEDAEMAELAPMLADDELQLLYSIVLHGQEELGLASDEYAAMVMVLLRVLAFTPFGNKSKGQAEEGANQAPVNQNVASENISANRVEAEKKTELQPEPPKQPANQSVNPSANQADELASDIPPWEAQGIEVGTEAAAPIPPQQPCEPQRGANTRFSNGQEVQRPNETFITQPQTNHDAAVDADDIELSHIGDEGEGDGGTFAESPATQRWFEVAKALIQQELVIALVRELVLNAQAESVSEDEQQWVLKCELETLISDVNQEKFLTVLQEFLGHPVRLELQQGAVKHTLAIKRKAWAQKRQKTAEAAVSNDPDIQKWLSSFSGARIVPGSVKPIG